MAATTTSASLRCILLEFITARLNAKLSRPGTLNRHFHAALERASFLWQTWERWRNLLGPREPQHQTCRRGWGCDLLVCMRVFDYAGRFALWSRGALAKTKLQFTLRQVAVNCWSWRSWIYMGRRRVYAFAHKLDCWGTKNHSGVESARSDLAVQFEQGGISGILSLSIWSVRIKIIKYVPEIKNIYYRSFWN